VAVNCIQAVVEAIYGSPELSEDGRVGDMQCLQQGQIADLELGPGKDCTGLVAMGFTP
jgi:hypothetical protein